MNIEYLYIFRNKSFIGKSEEYKIKKISKVNYFEIGNIKIKGEGLFIRLSFLDLEEGVLLEDAMEVGLMGVFFLSRRVLFKSFFFGECVGFFRGEDGFCKGIL